ncbi:hypothetical protein RCL_jg1054.t1 [Rhizophagus clarus]|uniref:Uncharacterized protein n=1 Tax=Rhizophagus clarus TaxID=94130 RepID=A0A8H3M4I9_9GLOM|nr:hypothetical protein RCL_jg1054.t1 [Rhizophagus clarus]
MISEKFRFLNQILNLGPTSITSEIPNSNYLLHVQKDRNLLKPNFMFLLAGGSVPEAFGFSRNIIAKKKNLPASPSKTSLCSLFIHRTS